MIILLIISSYTMNYVVSLWWVEQSDRIMSALKGIMTVTYLEIAQRLQKLIFLHLFTD